MGIKKKIIDTLLTDKDKETITNDVNNKQSNKIGWGKGSKTNSIGWGNNKR